MDRPLTRLLTRQDVADLLSLPDCIRAVAEAFRAHAEGRTGPPGVLGVPGDGGGFHIKAATLPGDPPLFAAKINGNFAGNPARGRPRIQGLVVLCDAGTGDPLAVMDSAELTALRTAAASAVAADHLARPDAGSVAIIGCGRQARPHLLALAAVRRLSRIRVCDSDRPRAVAFAREMAALLGIDAAAAADPAAAALESDMVVTCTPALAPILHRGDVAPGTFVAAVGADSETKQELDPALMAAAAVVPDIAAQAAAIGDLHHALAAGVMRLEDVRAELGAVVAGRAAGRRSPEEIVIFDSTGTALQDTAAAALVWRGAERAGRGAAIDFGAASGAA